MRRRASTGSSASSTTSQRAGSSATKMRCQRAPEWDEHTRLQNEKEVLGFFVSGHPLDKYREKLRNMKVVDTATACEMKPEPQVFRRGGEEPQNEISDRRRHHRAEGGEVEALGRAVCAGRRSKTRSARSS